MPFEYVYYVAVNKGKGFTVYEADPYYIIFIKDIKGNERLATNEIKTCIGLSFSTQTADGFSLHGMGHLFNYGNFRMLRDQSRDFVEKLPVEITQLELVFYYNLDARDSEKN